MSLPALLSLCSVHVVLPHRPPGVAGRVAPLHEMSAERASSFERAMEAIDEAQERVAEAHATGNGAAATEEERALQVVRRAMEQEAASERQSWAAVQTKPVGSGNATMVSSTLRPLRR